MFIIPWLGTPKIFAINTNFVKKLKKSFMIYVVKCFFPFKKQRYIVCCICIARLLSMRSTKMAFFVSLFFINPHCSVDISGCILFLIQNMVTRSITLVTWLINDIVQKFSQSTAPYFFDRVIKVDL